MKLELEDAKNLKLLDNVRLPESYLDDSFPIGIYPVVGLKYSESRACSSKGVRIENVLIKIKNSDEEELELGYFLFEKIS